MRPEPVLVLAALLAPLIGRWMAKRGFWRLRSPINVRSLAYLSLCILLWIAVAWGFSRSTEVGAPVHPKTLFAVLAFGLIWVESWLLLWRPLRRRKRAANGRPSESYRNGRPHPATPVGEGSDQSADPYAEPTGAEAPDLDDLESMGDPEIDPSADPAEGEPLSEEAEALLERILGLGLVPVEAIMTPRASIVYIEGAATAGQALDRMRETGRSRLIVVEGSPDRILGVVHAKDLVPDSQDGIDQSLIRSHLRRWLRIPKWQSTARLLEDFRRKRVHVAVVGDARGRTLGLVTLNDVFEYIAGAETAGGARQ